MRLVARGTVLKGRAIDARDLALSSVKVATAVHTSDAADAANRAADTSSGEESAGVRVACPPPGPIHEHVGVVHSGIRIDRRAALAAAARSRGRAVPQQSELTAARERLAETNVASVDLTAARRAVAEAGGDEARLRETAAELRGRIRTLREAGEATDDAVDSLTRTARRLSEAETERIAAEQRLSRAEQAARDARDARERRLRLEDRVGNLERRVRAALAASVGDEFDAAVRAVPGDGSPAERGRDPVAIALAVARVADLDAPIVLDVDRFPSADAAADWLDAPVILV